MYSDVLAKYLSRIMGYGRYTVAIARGGFWVYGTFAGVNGFYVAFSEVDDAHPQDLERLARKRYEMAQLDALPMTPVPTSLPPEAIERVLESYRRECALGRNHESW